MNHYADKETEKLVNELNSDELIDYNRKINELLKKDKLSEYKATLYEIDKKGNVILSINHYIPSSIRGTLLLDFEAKLKKNINIGICLWCQTANDKSKLRSLRGIKIKSL